MLLQRWGLSAVVCHEMGFYELYRSTPKEVPRRSIYRVVSLAFFFTNLQSYTLLILLFILYS
jgi:hypothetical protein